MSAISSSMSTSYANMMTQTQPPKKPEASDFANFLISSLDANSDSSLSADELSLSKDEFALLDGDSDGSISSEELTTTIASKLQEMEANKPSKEEFASMMSQMGIQPPPPPPPPSSTSEEDEDTTTSSSIDQESAMAMITQLLEMLKQESENNTSTTKNQKDTDMSGFKSLMSLMNSQTQDEDTATKLNQFLSNLVSNSTSSKTSSYA